MNTQMVQTHVDNMRLHINRLQNENQGYLRMVRGSATPISNAELETICRNLNFALLGVIGAVHDILQERVRPHR